MSNGPASTLMKAITSRSMNKDVLLPAFRSAGDKDKWSRLVLYTDWLDAQEKPWYAPELSAYRDYLLERGYAATSVRAHLTTVRVRYHELMRDNTLRRHLLETLDDTLHFDERKAIVDELYQQIDNAIAPAAAPVRIQTVQDAADSDHVRLNAEEASALIAMPGVDTMRGLRDTTLIALAVCTGVREAELCDVRLDDLRESLGGVLALRVRHGKGKKQRLIPYGQHEWVLGLIDRWLRSAEITEGYVFRGFWKGNRRVRPTPLTPRRLQDILKSYPVMVNGAPRALQPHDLRRSYAYIMYKAGMDLIAIQKNLGHTDLSTTQRYIGDLTAAERQPDGQVIHMGIDQMMPS